MRIHSKNNFITIGFETTEFWAFWWRSHQQEQQQQEAAENKMCSDMESGT